jgi:hypothetical protein
MVMIPLLRDNTTFIEGTVYFADGRHADDGISSPRSRIWIGFS